MSSRITLASLVLIGLLASWQLVHADQGLEPWQKNQWYWSFRGEPTLLLGGSDDDNLFQWQKKKLQAQLDRLADAGGNIIRNTMSDRKDKGFEVYPFLQLKNGKYDLNQWNPEYWDRFETLLRETSKRGIVVQIEIWDRFDYTDSGGGNRWQLHPYNPKNNVNYTYEESGFAQRYPDHPGRNRQAFFFTTPKQRNNKVVLPYQQKFVNKMLDIALKYDNVLFCMDNETSGEEEWGRYWANFVQNRAAKAGKKLYTTEMWDDWNITSKQHRRTLDHPKLYGFVDVSQNNHNKGQRHWDNFLVVRLYIAKMLPRPMNIIKVYGANGNKFGHTDQDAVERFWRQILAGAAAVRFHRPDSGLGLNDKAVASIRAARMLESKIPLWTVNAANDLLSDRADNEAYCSANAGKAYALYFPKKGAVKINLSTAKGKLTAHWIDIDQGKWGPQQQLENGPAVPLTPPGQGNWAVAIVAEK